MTVGLVFVSHSTLIAEGLVALAAQMAPGVTLVGAGGTDEGGIGTSFERVSSAIAAAESGDGVVILCDLGSAVLTAETALDFLDEELRARVVIADGPLVEGGVAAAVAAQTGGDRVAVAAAVSTAFGGRTDGAATIASEPRASEIPDDSYARTVTIVNKDGLHARPAADFVKLASSFGQKVTVNGKDAKSLLAIMALGLVKGREVEIATASAEGREAVDALADLVASGFDED